MKANKYILSLLLVCGLASSCDSILDIDPPTDSMTDTEIYSSEETIAIAASGLYTNNFLNNSIYYQMLEQVLGMTSDETRTNNINFAEYEIGGYTSVTQWFTNLWSLPYRTIYHANDFIINVEGTNLMNEQKRNVFLSEARFFRAYSYFLLVNIFGDVPLVLTNDYRESETMPRTPKADVYNQIIEDLKYAEANLVGSDNDKTKITSEAAKALLARVYLYTEQWDKAKAKANELIPSAHGGTGTKFTLEKADKVFKASSSESILHINMEGYIGAGTYVGYTRIGNFFIPTRSYVNYYLSDGLVKSILKDPKDLRKNWINFKENSGERFYYPFKYKNRKTPAAVEDYENLVLLRLTEQYLIRAEANAHSGNIPAAIEDLNIIRSRAGLDPIQSASNAELMLSIEEERRKEFFIECGHRWFDLNRTGRADEVYRNTSYKTHWKAYKSLIPIPDQERGRNPFLEQNPGYED